MSTWTSAMSAMSATTFAAAATTTTATATTATSTSTTSCCNCNPPMPAAQCVDKTALSPSDAAAFLESCPVTGRTCSTTTATTTTTGNRYDHDGYCDDDGPPAAGKRNWLGMSQL